MVGGVLELTGDTVNFIQKIIVFCCKVSQEELDLTWLYSSVKPEMSPLAFEEREWLEKGRRELPIRGADEVNFLLMSFNKP